MSRKPDPDAKRIYSVHVHCRPSVLPHLCELVKALAKAIESNTLPEEVNVIKHSFSRRRRSGRPLGEDLRRPAAREEQREEFREDQREEDTALRYGWDADGREVPS